ncbi:MAG: helix-turn-helix transcriptional regulator [Bacteroidia bacterium]|nr:helix-turn-helix transcriptional regulator [Bacteroidia bacterium]
MANYKNEAFMVAFGKNLRRLRKSKGLSMEALAFECGFTYSQIARIEGAKINTTISTAAKLAEGLGITVPELFEFEW